MSIKKFLIVGFALGLILVLALKEVNGIIAGLGFIMFFFPFFLLISGLTKGEIEEVKTKDRIVRNLSSFYNDIKDVLLLSVLFGSIGGGLAVLADSKIDLVYHTLNWVISQLIYIDPRAAILENDIVETKEPFLIIFKNSAGIGAVLGFLSGPISQLFQRSNFKLMKELRFSRFTFSLEGVILLIFESVFPILRLLFILAFRLVLGVFMGLAGAFIVAFYGVLFLGIGGLFVYFTLLKHTEGLLEVSLAVGIFGGALLGLILGIVIGLFKGIDTQLENSQFYLLITKPYQRFEASIWVLHFSIIRHFNLRWLLYRKGLLPWKLVKFLKEVTKHYLMESDGGSWQFRHRILQNYFVEHWQKEYAFEYDKEEISES